jgi:opacity protein-like surface antigen
MKNGQSSSRGSVLFAFACAGLLLAGRANAAQGFYFNAGAGVALAEDVKLKEFFGPAGNHLDFDPGVRFTASGGYNFNDFVGLEGETGWIYNDIQHVDASLSHVPMMANVVFRYDRPDCKLVPYAGAGLGGDVSIIWLDHVTGNGVIADGSEGALQFAWQAFAGVRYRFNPAMSIGAGYRYYSVEGASWDFAGFDNSIRVGRANVHSILVEFNMKF